MLLCNQTKPVDYLPFFGKCDILKHNFDDEEGIPMVTIWILLLGCAALGLVLCFRGKQFTFLAMGLLAALYARYVWPSYFPANIWGTVMVVIVGLLAAGMIHTLYKVGMFAVGAVLGVAAGFFLLGTFPALETAHWAVLGICAVALGIFAVLCSDWFVVVATGFGGAMFTVLAATFAYAERSCLGDYVGETLTETALNVTSVLNRTYIEGKGVAPALLLLVLGTAGVMVQKKDM